MPKLTVSALVPDFEFQIINADDTVKAMATHTMVRVRRRALAGQGSRGPLPTPQDGRAWKDTGQLLDSVDVQMRQGRGLPYALVLPTGLRSNAEEVAQRRKSRSKAARDKVRTRLKGLRKRGRLGLGEEGIRSKAARAAAEARRLGRKGVRVAKFRAILRRADRAGKYGISDAYVRDRVKKAGRIGYRQAKRNMDVAAILANKPKDANSIKGNRGVYHVIESNKADEKEARDVAVKVAKYELVEKGSRVAHRGTGVAT
jgi:hypothetical protein